VLPIIHYNLAGIQLNPFDKYKNLDLFFKPFFFILFFSCLLGVLMDKRLLTQWINKTNKIADTHDPSGHYKFP